MFLEIPQITEQRSDKICSSDSLSIPQLSEGFQNQKLGYHQHRDYKGSIKTFVKICPLQGYRS